MVPTFGRDPRWGTNPIAVAAPCAAGPPFVYDAARTAVAGNTISAARRLGAVVPGGCWPTPTARRCWRRAGPDPALYLGLLSPGSTPELASHKGYGLACVVEVLRNGLGGLTFGMRAGPAHGHCLAASTWAPSPPPPRTSGPWTTSCARLRRPRGRRGPAGAGARPTRVGDAAREERPRRPAPPGGRGLVRHDLRRARADRAACRAPPEPRRLPGCPQVARPGAAATKPCRRSRIATGVRSVRPRSRSPEAGGA